MLSTLLKTVLLTPVLCLAVFLFAFLGLPSEVTLFYEVAAFAIAGAVAGRSGTFPWAAFPVAFLGGFIGYVVFFSLATPPMVLPYAIVHAAIAGSWAWVAAKAGMEAPVPARVLESEEKRQCRSCGVRVGMWANKCWSCRASLHQIA